MLHERACTEQFQRKLSQMILHFILQTEHVNCSTVDNLIN